MLGTVKVGDLVTKIGIVPRCVYVVTATYPGRTLVRLKSTCSERCPNRESDYTLLWYNYEYDLAPL